MPEQVLAHFADKEPVVKSVYDKLIAAVQKFGPVKVEPKKTCIHLSNRFGFAGVYTRRSYIILEFHLDYKLNNPRITKVEQASANRFHHTTKLSSDKDINKELCKWLLEAYQLKA